MKINGHSQFIANEKASFTWQFLDKSLRQQVLSTSGLRVLKSQSTLKSLMIKTICATFLFYDILII